MTDETQNAESDDAKRKLATEAASDVSQKEAPPPIALAVDHYLSSVRGIARTARIAIPHINRWKYEEIKTHVTYIDEFLGQYKKNQDSSENTGKNNAQGPSTLVVTSARDLAKFINAAREVQELDAFNSTAILTKSLFTQIFSEFDAFMGSLLKILYLKNEDLLKSIAREISFEDLLGFDNLQAVKLSMLDKEIETFRRDSYVEQFSTLEKKFKIPLKKFPEWADFVELSQRRNILTHNGGGVSDQYISICEREGYKFKEKPKKGEYLGVSIDYLFDAGRLLSKVGLMLAFTLWFKMSPKECEKIHESLNNVIFHSLQQKRWYFVAELTDFVLGKAMCTGISDVMHRIRLINAAIGLKFSGKDKESEIVLDSVDWSASYRDFKLANAVLRDNFTEAVSLMKSIGKSGEIIRKESYHYWPLFSAFRERPEFYAAYFEVYGEPFSETLDTPEGSFEAQAETGSPTGAKQDMDVTDVDSRDTSASREGLTQKDDDTDESKQESPPSGGL